MLAIFTEPNVYNCLHQKNRILHIVVPHYNSLEAGMKVMLFCIAGCLSNPGKLI